MSGANAIGQLAKLGLLAAPLAPRDERVPSWESAEPKEWFARRMAVYAAMVEQMDRGIGKLLDALERARDGEEHAGRCSSPTTAGAPRRSGPRGVRQHFPRRTRDGRPVRLGNGTDILPGPEDTYASYGLEWAHASNTPFRLFKSFVHEGGIATPSSPAGPA